MIATIKMTGLEDVAATFAEWERAMRELNAPDVIVTGWTETHKLKPTGAGHRDRLVAARINLRRDA